MEKYCTAGQITDDNMKHVRCMLEPKATDTHLEYVILIAIPRQQLRYFYMAFLIILLILFLSNWT